MAAQAASPRKNSPEGTSRSMAVLLTMLVWVAAFSVVILLPPVQPEKPREPVYQSIALTLAPLSGISQPAVAGQMAPTESLPGIGAAEVVSGRAPVSEERTAQEPLSSAMSSAVPTHTPPVQKQASSSKQEASTSSQSVAAAPSRAPAPATPPPAAPVPPPLASPSISAASPLHDQEPVDPSSFDQASWEALFGESSSRYTSSPTPGSPPAVPLDSISSLSGVAATAANTASSGVSSDSASGREGSSSPAAGTTKSLAGIATAAVGEAPDTGAIGAGSPATGKAGGKSASSTDEAGGTSLELVGGGRRRLLEPAEPVILISRENQRLIPGSLEVTITFEITPEGVVLPGSIKITPESLVHNQVQEEIRTQIGKWRFQVAEGSGQVRFKYNIMKK